MLGLNKQPGNMSCFAYALLNLGRVNKSAVQEYDERGEKWETMPALIQQMMFYSGQVKKEDIPGSWEFVSVWLRKYAPELIDPMRPGFSHTSLYYQQQPAITIPKDGRGIVLVSFSRVESGHAIAYENGMFSDSGDPGMHKLETWDEFVYRSIMAGEGRPHPVLFVPVPETKEHAEAA